MMMMFIKLATWRIGEIWFVCCVVLLLWPLKWDLFSLTRVFATSLLAFCTSLARWLARSLSAPHNSFRCCCCWRRRCAQATDAVDYSKAPKAAATAMAAAAAAARRLTFEFRSYGITHWNPLKRSRSGAFKCAVCVCVCHCVECIALSLAAGAAAAASA